MELENPFKSPTDELFDTTARDSSIRIEPFQVRASGFDCTVYTEDQVSEMLAKELAAFCEEQGFRISQGKSEYTIRGEIVKVEQGSQILRYFLPFIAGEAKVEIHGEVAQGPHSTKPFHVKKTFSMGAFGGNSKAMIRDGLRHAAMRIAADAGLVGVQTAGLKRTGDSPAASSSAWLYLGGVLLAAVVIAIVAGYGAYQWSLTVPERHDGIALEDRGGWGIFVGVLIFFAGILGGLATAPDSVLKSSALIWLRTRSGMKSLVGQRILLGIVCAVPIVVAFFSKALL